MTTYSPATEKFRTATLYAFPPKPWGTGTGFRDRQPIADRGVPLAPAVEFGSGWYHEAAVRASEPSRKS